MWPLKTLRSHRHDGYVLHRLYAPIPHSTGRGSFRWAIILECHLVNNKVHAISLGKREKRKSSARETLSLYPKIAESNREIIKTTGTEDTKKGTFFFLAKNTDLKKKKKSVYFLVQRDCRYWLNRTYIYTVVCMVSLCGGRFKDLKICSGSLSSSQWYKRDSKKILFK